jgi:hypothetical protein
VQGERVDVGGGHAAGQGLSRLDGSQVEKVTRIFRKGWAPGRAPLGRFDIGHVAQVESQGPGCSRAVWAIASRALAGTVPLT